MNKDKEEWIIVEGARESNLKNINVKIPKNKLVCFTGVSGSGKSSLAYKTIYVEGRRRYIESLSNYDRQILGYGKKPDVDNIEGLSPAIFVGQKIINNSNHQNTVGTVTGIYDYLRLLYTHAGTPYCLNGHGIIKFAVTIKEIINQLKQKIKKDDKIMILSPIVVNKKGRFDYLFSFLKQKGFLRVRIDNEIKILDENIKLDKNCYYDIDIVIDRINFDDNNEIISRIYEAIEVAIRYSSGSLVKIYLLDHNKELSFSNSYSCKICGFVVPELTPKLFSLNSSLSMCAECKGLGIKLEVDKKLLISNLNLKVLQWLSIYFKKNIYTNNIEWQKFKILTDYYHISMNKSMSDLTDFQLKVLLHGSFEKIKYDIKIDNNKVINNYDYIEGIFKLIKKKYTEAINDSVRKYWKQFMIDEKCIVCKGKRLSNASLMIKINDLDIIDFTNLSIIDELEQISNLNLTINQNKITKLIIDELINRLDFLNKVGLNYLTLSRSIKTLSRGEVQRVKLATQISSKLSDVLYVLDEPTTGLHQRDNYKLVLTLKTLRDLGNTLIIIEHNEEIINNSDYIIDIGPGAGVHGGEVVAFGNVNDIKNNCNSITGKYLKGIEKINIPKKHHNGNGLFLEIRGARQNNLKNIDVIIPLNKLVCFTGVSGSGKSTLMNDIIWKGIGKELKSSIEKSGIYDEIIGINNINKIINISQVSIGKTLHRSNLATYTSIFNDIRDLFANVSESRIRGYSKGRFSFNIPGGRCENCHGDGIMKISMLFLPSMYINCEVCKGKRYNDETLMIKYKSKSIYDVLQMTVDEAYVFFNNKYKIKHKLQIIKNIGLGYIKLGQSVTELSVGEIQRVKLSNFLLKKTNGKTLFLLDEPTIGLHADDIKKLLSVLNKIIDNGDSIIIIEHNLDVIKTADYIVDLGPEGGYYGGNVIAIGTPEQIVSKRNISYTAQYLYLLFK